MNTEPSIPLAEFLRPKNVGDIIGQDHLLGDGQSLKVAITSGNLPSMILWGPPGVGKTTIARVIANSTDAQFISISAVLSGVKEIRESIEKAKFSLEQQNKKTILFIDEVHRFNKGQQDAFLPHIESGLITLIGATTENPSFEVNTALLSRCQIYVLKILSLDELNTAVPVFIVPEYTLINVREPTNGSFATLKANAEKGALSSNFISISSSEPNLVPLIEPISTGLGK